MDSVLKCVLASIKFKRERISSFFLDLKRSIFVIEDYSNILALKLFFMSSVATDSNDGHEFNLKENGFHFFK